MTDDRATRLICRKANRHTQDGLNVNDAVMLAFTDFDLNLPLAGHDKDGRPEWVGWTQSGDTVYIQYRGIQEETEPDREQC